MKILISDKIHEGGIKIFEENGFEVDKEFTISNEELKKKIQEYDGIVVRSRTKLTTEVLDQAVKLKVIGRAGVGLDNINLKKASEMDIEVLNTPEAPSITVAEFALGLMFSLARHISIADETMHKGEWNKSQYLGFTLHSKKLGLIGFGNIGKALATRAISLGMKVGVYSRFSAGPQAVKEAKDMGCHIYPSVEDLLKDADVVSLHLPATPQTENIINKRSLSLMKKDALLINTARGQLIDENALIKALQEDKMGGAAIDVYRKEPLDNQGLMKLEKNLILTPHIASQSKENQVQAATMIAKKMVKFLKDSL
ncbi:MAG: hydroxyacid dehydrogenase [Promethearchaeota archaeon]|nr:MAG: hydroxyacid dehydrogenase [Candidatus Lokiarchaeota archaeon]